MLGRSLQRAVSRNFLDIVAGGGSAQKQQSGTRYWHTQLPMHIVGLSTDSKIAASVDSACNEPNLRAFSVQSAETLLI